MNHLIYKTSLTNYHQQIKNNDTNLDEISELGISVDNQSMNLNNYKYKILKTLELKIKSSKGGGGCNKKK